MKNQKRTKIIQLVAEIINIHYNCINIQLIEILNNDN
jgi:hypothetical protein